MTWILFSILAALVWAIVNTADKFVLTKIVKKPIVPVMIMGLIGFAIGVVVYFIHGFSELSSFNIFLALMAAIFYVLTIMLYFRAAKIEEISRVVPLAYLTPLFILIFAGVLLDERITFIKILGVLFLVGGSILISFKNSLKLSFGKAFWLMVLSAVTLAINSVITKYLLEFADYWTIFAYTRGIGITVALIPFFYLNFSDLMMTVKENGKKAIGLISLNESLRQVGGLFITIAISLGSVTLVNALASLQPFFVLVFMVILSIFYPHILKEEIGKSTLTIKIIAIILIFIGAVLIT